MSHLIPFEILRPHVERYLRSQLPGFEEEVDPYGAEVQALAARAGLHPDTISKPYEGLRVSISYRNADKIIAAMGNPMIWHTDPELRAHYWEGKPEPPDPMKPVKCQNPKCDEWLPLEEVPTTGAVEGATRYRKTIYCDDACKAQAYRAKHGRRHARAVKRSRNRSPQARERYNAYMRDYRAKRSRARAAAVAA